MITINYKLKEKEGFHHINSAEIAQCQELAKT
jgi:hypothetical protein